MTYPVIVLVLALALCYAAYRRERYWRGEVRDAKREGADRLIGKQKELDVAVTATLTRMHELLRKELLDLPDSTLPDFNTGALGALFDKAVALESVGVHTMVQDLRDKTNTLDAATRAAQATVTRAASELVNVRAENTLHRKLLEQALTLPLDTPDAKRALFLTRCEAVLSSARATHDCPSEDFWKAYVLKHKTVNPVATGVEGL